MINFAHAHLISRPRLLAKIQQAPEHRITFISAPVGFGKTVLAEQFTEVSPFPVAWHRVEERERDVPKLFAHSLAALSAISPEIRSLPRSIDASPSDLAAQIGAYLQDTLDFRFFYIMDDIHHIGGSVAAGKWLESLISHVPENCHLILISRTHLSLPVNLLLRDKVLVINESDLRLTDDELTQLAKQIAKGGFHAARLGEIRQQFDGWIAGSIVALRPLPPEIRRADISGGQNDALALFAVLAKNILVAQPPAIHRFLLVSSVLQKITPELCQNALHLVNANSYLSQIAARNLFLSRTDDGVAYHVLFRDFLQGQLRELDASGFKAFHNQAADYFAQIDQLDDAFYHYLRASNAEGAVRIADRAADALYAEGHIETLLDWADKLNTTNERSPKLLTVCAMIRLDRYEYRDAEALLLEAQLLFQQANDAFGTGRIEFQRAMLDQQRGQLQDAVTRAEKLLASTQSARLRGNALNVLGLAHLDSGNLPSAIQSFKAALPFYTTHLDANAKAKLYQNLGVAFERAGDLKQARACLQQAVVLLRALGSNRALAFALSNLGFYFYLSADYRQAQATLEEGLALASGTLDKRPEAYLLWNLGDLDRDRGLGGNALRYYSTALELVGDSDPFLRASLLISLAQLKCWEGKWEEASTTVNEVVQSSIAQNIAVPYQLARAITASCQAQQGHSTDVLATLDSVKEVLIGQGARLKLLFVLTLAARTALQISGRRVSRRYLAEALDLAQELDTWQYLVSECAHCTELRAFLETSFSKHPITGLVLKTRASPEAIMSELSFPDIPRVTQNLTIVTLGRIRVSRDGEIVRSQAWQAISAQELFLYLLFEGPVDKDGVGLEFWPDLDPQQVRNNFHTSLRRARDAVGDHALIFSDGQYSINPTVGIRCDAFDLTTFVEKARLMAPQDARTEELFTKASDLYQGEFLPTMHMAWVTSHRFRLQEAYLDALLGRSHCRLAWEDYRAAEELLHQVLTLEPYREDVHRLLLRCYAAAGERQQLLAHYDRMIRLFELDLRTSPAAETVDLFQALLRS